MPRYLLEWELGHLDQQLPRDFTRPSAYADDWIEAVEIDDA